MGFDEDEEKTVKNAVNLAKKLTEKKGCDEALNEISDGEIPSLHAIVSKYLDSNGNLANISDGRTVSADNFGIDNPSVPAFVQGRGTASAQTYLNTAFFNIGGNKLGNDKAKAIVIIHEAVHQFVKGLTTFGTATNRDVYYSRNWNGDLNFTKEQQQAGSRELTALIVGACYPALTVLIDSPKNI